MNRINFLFVIVILFLINSCAKEEKEISYIKESEQKLEMISAYQEAYAALNKNDTFFAAKKFLEAELLFPQSEWAPRSALMASYSYYMQDFYAEALSNLERYLKTYPNDTNLSYAHYLIAICYYETIEDEKRDSAPLFK
jgi:outer membrane protein assembly factor BamD